MGFSREEQETVLVYNRMEDKWDVYTRVPSHITDITKKYGNNDEIDLKFEYEDGRESPVSLTTKLNSNQISFRKGAKRKMTEEQRQAAAERMKNMHKKK